MEREDEITERLVKNFNSDELEGFITSAIRTYHSSFNSRFTRRVKKRGIRKVFLEVLLLG